MKLRIDEYVLKFTGSVNLPEALSHGQDYELLLKGSCYKREELDNQDGSIDVIYKIRPYNVEVKGESDKVIVSKDKRKKSQQLRYAIRSWWEFKGCPGDEEEFYEKVMDSLIHQTLDKLE